jgi:hypothetical protein
VPEAPPSLGELQRLLFALIRAPEGVPAALKATGISRRCLAGLVDADERLTAAGRAAIYADMYFLRLQEVLREMFPRLRALLGDDHFAGLCTDYLDACPSQHPSLRFLGDRLAAFLVGPAERRPRSPRLPAWAADLAALEWARYDVFDDADAPLWTTAGLQKLPPTAFATLPLRLAPAHRRVPVAHAIEDVWRALHRQLPPGEARPRPGQLLVWRQDKLVFHRRPDPLEAALLDQLAAGTSFGAVCEQIADRSPDPAQAAFTLLARWAADGLLVRIDPA